MKKTFTKLIITCALANLSACSDTSTQKKQEVIPNARISLEVLNNPDNCKQTDCKLSKKDVTTEQVGLSLKNITVPNGGHLTIQCFGYNLKTDMPNIVPIAFTLYSQDENHITEKKWHDIMRDIKSDNTWNDVCMKKRERQSQEIKKGSPILDEFTGNILLEAIPTK